MYDKVFVYYPKGVRTGGPEALHQLVGELCAQGVDAFLVPEPGTADRPSVPDYQIYAAPEAARVADGSRNAVIASELAIGLLRNFRLARRFCWWLSIDNSPVFRDRRALQNLPRSEGFSATRGRLLGALAYKRIRQELDGTRKLVREIEHLTQSQYAWSQLFVTFGVTPTMLSDHTPITDLPAPTSFAERGRSVAFNPKKSGQLVTLLEKEYPTADFVPLENMSKIQVLQTLAHTAVYLDLGFHPGKDRMPREAALLECVVIVRRVGSAAFSADVPLPWSHKVSTPEQSNTAVRSVLDRALAEPMSFLEAQENYVRLIRGERTRFRNEATAIFLRDELGSDQPLVVNVEP